MAKRLIVLFAAGMLLLSAGTAVADSIKNRVGVTGKIGFIVPSDNAELFTGTTGTNADFIGGGGFIYGITDNIAGEFDITHASTGDFDITNITFGAQYRFLNLPIPQLVPYAGGGLDVLLNGVKTGSVDDVVGVHAALGADYFFTRELAATAELKGVIASDADIRAPGGQKIGDFDPDSFSMTFGVRYFFY